MHREQLDKIFVFVPNHNLKVVSFSIRIYAEYVDSYCKTDEEITVSVEDDADEKNFRSNVSLLQIFR